MYNDKEEKLKEYFATMSLEKLNKYRDQCEHDAWMETEIGIDNTWSLKKVKWLDREIARRDIES